MPLDNPKAVMLGALTIAFLIIGGVVALKILASVTPTYAESAASISENVSTADWGDDTANDIAPTFGMVLSLSALFGLVALAIGAVVVGHKKGYF